MEVFLQILLLGGGLAFAVFGANILVDGCSAVARRFNVPSLIIGTTIVAFGTSLPELTVNTIASVNGHTALAISNITGSNIFNIFLIIGVAGLIFPLVIQKETYFKDMPLNLLASVLLLVCANELMIDYWWTKMTPPDANKVLNGMTRVDGIVFLAFFCIFIYYTFASALSGEIKDTESAQDANKKKYGVFKSILFIVLGLAGLICGGELIVKGAVEIASAFGIPHHVIGLLIVGPGTSIPEFFTSVVAAIKKKPDLAVGNIVGSNIFNLFFILGLSSVICPLPFDSSLNLSVIVMIVASLMLYIFTFCGKTKKIGRPKAAIFLVSILVYYAYLIMNVKS